MAFLSLSGRSAAPAAFLLAAAFAAAPASVPAQGATSKAGGVEISFSADAATSGPAAASTPIPVSPGAKSAMDAANKLVAPAGADLRSTEDSAGGAVAPAPRVRFDGGNVTDASGNTTRTEAVKNMAQLMAMIGVVPKPKAGTTERDDKGAVNIFPNEAEVKRLLGEKPAVVYQVVVAQTPLPDPMIIPWIRGAKVAEETYEDAVRMIGQGDVGAARQALLSIVTDYPETDWATQSRALIVKLDEYGAAKVTPTPRAVAKGTPTPVPITLNPNVKIGLVLQDDRNPALNKVSIGGRTYFAGKSIAGYPDHKIISITRDEIVIEVAKGGTAKQFNVPVRKQDKGSPIP